MKFVPAPHPRRRRILEAALACFVDKGYAATTIDDLRRACGASVGSLYHHFGSKEQLAGALYVEGLRDYHEELLARIDDLDAAEALVKGIVEHHVRWVVERPAWARYLIEMRRVDSVAARDREIRALTRRTFSRLEQRLEPLVRSGRLSKLSGELLAAIATGPAQALAAHWIPRGRIDELRAAAPILAEAAWRALRRPF